MSVPRRPGASTHRSALPTARTNSPRVRGRHVRTVSPQFRCVAAPDVACPARSGSATSARPPTPGSTPWPAPGRRGGRSCRSGRPASATRRTSRFSAFAGNLILISPELLRPRRPARGRRPGRRSPSRPTASTTRPSSRSRCGLRPPGLGRTSGAARAGHLRGRLRRASCTERRGWLDDYALFMALKDAHGGRAVVRLAGRAARPRAGRRWRRDPPASWPTRSARTSSASSCSSASGTTLRGYARAARRQADRRRADLRRRRLRRRLGQPATCSCSTRTAGRRSSPACRRTTSPPTGQLWGNPLYDWEAHGRRPATPGGWPGCGRRCEQVDLVRLDHFRGFEAYWEVPAGEPTADDGRWVPGPGRGPVRRACATRPRRAAAHRRGPGRDHARTSTRCATRFGLPGMRVLQFALRRRRRTRSCRTTTTRTASPTPARTTTTRPAAGAATAPDDERRFYRRYTGRDGSDIAWDLIRLAWVGVADLAIAPLQDVLDLGTEARMNLPGVGEGNWRWRMPTGRWTTGGRSGWRS